MLTSSTVFTELMLVRLSARLCTVRTTEDNIYRLHKRRTCMQVFKICAMINEITELEIECEIIPLPVKDENIPIEKYFIYGFFKEECFCEIQNLLCNYRIYSLIHIHSFNLSWQQLQLCSYFKSGCPVPVVVLLANQSCVIFLTF